MSNYLRIALCLVFFTCTRSGPIMRTLSQPEQLGESVEYVPRDAWWKCKEQVREDLLYDPASS